MVVLHAIGVIFLYLWIFWGLFVLFMGLYRAHLDKRLNILCYVLGAPFIAIGWLMDLFTNLIFGTILFLEFPRELMLSSRMKRLNNGAGWRSKISNAICKNLLDIFDPSGDHC